MAKEETFAKQLRAWREARKWLQKEAANALEVSLDTYRGWEHGATMPHESPSLREIEQRMMSK